MNKEKRLLMKGIRGAIQVAKNERESILQATQELMRKIVSANKLETENIVSVFFTTTKDLDAEFPAYALREMGWKYVPVLCVQEINVPQSMKKVIRVLILAYTENTQKEIRHQYLGSTAQFRPDLVEE